MFTLSKTTQYTFALKAYLAQLYLKFEGKVGCRLSVVEVNDRHVASLEKTRNSHTISNKHRFSDMKDIFFSFYVRAPHMGLRQNIKKKKSMKLFPVPANSFWMF